MARTIHLFIVVSGLTMMAEGVIGLFYQPGWMVQQNAITIRGLAAAVAFGFALAVLDRLFRWVRETVGRGRTSVAVVDAAPASFTGSAAPAMDRDEEQRAGLTTQSVQSMRRSKAVKHCLAPAAYTRSVGASSWSLGLPGFTPSSRRPLRSCW